MHISQTLFLAFAASLPPVALAGIVRGVVCIYRTARVADWPLVVLAVVAVLILLAVSAGTAVLWFIAAVSHGPKDDFETALLLAGSGLAIYIVAAGVWVFCRYAESGRRLAGTSPRQDTGSRQEPVP